MLPVAKELIGKNIVLDIIIMVHPLSQPLFEKEGIPYYKPESTLGGLLVSDDSRENYLKKQNTGCVFCTTSSPYKDLTYSNLILAARNLPEKIILFGSYARGNWDEESDIVTIY